MIARADDRCAAGYAGADGAVCGIDEAGRGPLAGPVCAAAVVLPDSFPSGILGDSKRLTEAARTEAAALIRARARCYGVGWASHEEIDALNILNASLLAMRRAFIAMTGAGAARIGRIIIDGLYAPDLRDCAACAITPLVKADSKVPEVMAASILAKTERDKEMRRLAGLYPAYRYEKHKGYPTKEHAELIRRYGPSPVQRLTFRVPGL